METYSRLEGRGARALELPLGDTMVNCTRILIITMCLVIVTMHAKSFEESCGVVELVQDIMVLTCLYKSIICMVHGVRTITTLIQAKQRKFRYV